MRPSGPMRPYSMRIIVVVAALVMLGAFVGASAAIVLLQQPHGIWVAVGILLVLVLSLVGLGAWRRRP